MITIYENKMTAQQFAVYAVCSYGAFTARDYWEATGELAESALVMTPAEKARVDQAIDALAQSVLDNLKYDAVHTIVFGEEA